MTNYASDFLKKFGPLRVSKNLESRDSSLKQNEIIAILRDIDDDDDDLEIKEINGTHPDKQIKIPSGDRLKCKFNSSIQLWKDQKILTLTHGEPVIGGSVSKTVLASEIPVDFAPNFAVPIPDEFNNMDEDLAYDSAVDNELKPVIIAVLDTGIDQDVPKEFLWTKSLSKTSVRGVAGENGPDYGQSFTDDNQIWSKPRQHNRNRGLAENAGTRDTNDKNDHGTLVSLYIINEFVKKGVPVKLMVLKTHNEKGEGDFFTIYQAMQFAIENGAHIINASWGFYSYLDKMGEFLEKQLGNQLREKNILLVTAAGNSIDGVDNQAIENFKTGRPTRTTDKWAPRLSDGLLRNLEIHNFFPACLSNKTNNVIAVTTVYDNNVSETQNYSKKHVDIGIHADRKEDNRLLFNIPFQQSGATSGSSFAAAIATGIIGANIVSKHINSDDPLNLTKEKVLEDLSSITRKNKSLADKIKKGAEVPIRS